MSDPERVYSIIAGVIAAALLSILAFCCRKRDWDAARHLLILDILVAAHTLEWSLIVLLELCSQWSPGANKGDPVTGSRAVLWLPGMTLCSAYLSSFALYFLFLPVILFLKNGRKKPIIWVGATVFAFYLLAALECLIVNFT